MRYRGFPVLIFALVLAVSVTAVTPQFWENFTQEELLKGTLAIYLPARRSSKINPAIALRAN